MPIMAYRIRDWDTVHEKSDTRKVHNALTWISVPNRHDSSGFRRLMKRQTEGVLIYGAYMLMAEVSSKLPKPLRGWLVDRAGGLDAEGLADKTGAPQEVFELALSVLSDKRIGWLRLETIPENLLPLCPDASGDRLTTRPDVTLPNPTLPNGTVPYPTVQPDEVEPIRSGVSSRAVTPAPVKRAGKPNPGPDRDNGTPQLASQKARVDQFVLALCEAFQLKDAARVSAQHRAFARVGWYCLASSEFDSLAGSLVALAAAKKADASLNDPIRAWQAEVSRILKSKGLINDGKENPQAAG